MNLDLSNYKKAVNSLKEAVEISKKLKIGHIVSPEEKLMRAGVIQNFEFTFELSWKFIKRALEIYYDINDELSKSDLFRTAFEKNLILNVDDWRLYNKLRNETSHIYDEVKADGIFSFTEQFLKDAEKLLETLEKLNGK
ncbi:MAG: nucleotidyltransferase substrate binding protein [Endomicrobia bacterium]|nr:nucleotidyltransferase substrate binding protein [Endomicrobiia bacterium]